MAAKKKKPRRKPKWQDGYRLVDTKPFEVIIDGARIGYAFEIYARDEEATQP